MENECEALPGVAYPRVRDNRSTINTKTGYDDDVSFLRCLQGGPKHDWYNFVIFCLSSFVSDIRAEREQINAKIYLCRNTGCRYYVLSRLATRGQHPRG